LWTHFPEIFCNVVALGTRKTRLTFGSDADMTLLVLDVN